MRVVLWLVVAAGFCLLMKYDVTLMRWRHAVMPEGPQGTLKQVLFGLRDFAQIVPIMAILIVIATYDRRCWRIIATVLLAQIVAGVGYNSGKLLIPRYRPDADVPMLKDLSALTTTQTWLARDAANTDMSTQSFPSGHSAAAFALAGVLSRYYRRLAWMFWVLAIGCAASRVLDAVHWPSDCLAGAAIGYVAAWLSLVAAGRRRGADADHA